MTNKKRRRVRTQAVLWSLRARSGGENVTASLEEWLEKDEAHGVAFAEAQWAWQNLDQIDANVEKSSVVIQMARPAKKAAANSNVAPRAWMALAACLVVFAAVGFMNLGPHHPSYRAGVGEQRVVSLEDGTRVILNTDTEVITRFADNQRHVELVRGEALFNVAHDAGRPFIVEAANERIRALGTSFVVRSEAGRIEVTLLSGRVEVTGGSNNLERKIALSPGERLSSAADKPGKVDLPKIEVVTAWSRGEMILEETPLADAIREMNRYSKKPIVLSASLPVNEPISGVFRVAETREFASTVAAIFDMKLSETKSELSIQCCADQ